MLLPATTLKDTKRVLIASSFSFQLGSRTSCCLSRCTEKRPCFLDPKPPVGVLLWSGMGRGVHCLVESYSSKSVFRICSEAMFFSFTLLCPKDDGYLVLPFSFPPNTPNWHTAQSSSALLAGVLQALLSMEASTCLLLGRIFFFFLPSKSNS